MNQIIASLLPGVAFSTHLLKQKYSTQINYKHKTSVNASFVSDMGPRSQTEQVSKGLTFELEAEAGSAGSPC